MSLSSLSSTSVYNNCLSIYSVIITLLLTSDSSLRCLYLYLYAAIVKVITEVKTTPVLTV